MQISRPIRPALLSLAILAATAWSSAASAAAPLIPPQGYSAPIEQMKTGDHNFSCPAIAQPYTGALVFRSKYEGSDKARATLNEDAEKAFRDATQSITELERGISKVVMQYMRDGRPEQLDCALNTLTTWARAGALESLEFNHTGKSMRKWALGSMSAAYLRLKFSDSRPLANHQQQAQEIEAWFSKLGDLVVSDWSNLPLEKINNHSYWAAWSVMATAVATNRRDLFDWAVKEFRVAANQVSPEGFLPNEMKRRQRALAYHNYALPPLAMVASFARANGVDLRQENHAALQRLANRVLEGVRDPNQFADRGGEKQDMTDLKKDPKFAWLEPYCSLYECDGEVLEKKHEKQPFKTFRLGGDLTRVYDPAHDRDKQ